MSPSFFLLFIFLELRTEPGAVDAGTPAAETKDFLSPERNFPKWVERAKVLERYARGTKSRSFGGNAEQSSPGGDPHGPHSPLRTGEEGAQPANTSSERRSGLFNPLYPLTDGSCWAYALLLLALLLLAAGVVANLALMCAVWHSVQLKSAWNCVLAGLALWDFLVLFFCLPVVVFHELSVKRLLGDLSCRLVPYLEVSASRINQDSKSRSSCKNLWVFSLASALKLCLSVYLFVCWLVGCRLALSASPPSASVR